jgi:DNA-binding winged helix-turn-helix (wHTH) protein
MAPVGQPFYSVARFRFLNGMKYFLSHRFDERDGSLSRNSKSVAITRKASDLLRCLIERAGTVVSHDAILSAVWPDAHVQPDNIKVLVRELRRALDDDPHAPQYIRTENGRGYAFVAPLHDSPGLPVDDRFGSRQVRVNRAAHLSVLVDALADAAHTRCTVAVIEGERGIGKTTLCEAFMDYAATVPSTRVCYGQSFPHATAPAPYSAVSDALQHLLRQAPATIEALLARHAPLWLAHLRPGDPGGHVRAEGVADPLRRVFELGAFLEALGEDGPTAIVLDDLQWADAESITLIQALARRHAPLRTLILLACTRLPPTASGTALWRLLMELWSTGRCVMRRLKPLSEDDVRDCLGQRFGGTAVPALAPMIHRLTGGNPLALSAVMHAFVSGDVGSGGTSGWALRPPAASFDASLPESVREALLWRFTQLDTPNRVLLESAASVGPAFTSHDVAAAAGIEAVPRITHQLDALCARGFIERLGADPSGAKRYGFTHPLHAELLASRAALFDQIYAAERLAERGAAGTYN